MGQGDALLASIILFAGNFAPRNWAFCNGQLLAISQNTALFSLLGTTYGGDGRTTFGLPDLRGRVPISQGTGPGLPTYRLGQRSGQATHVLTNLELPSHNHAATATVTGNVSIGVNNEGSDTANPDGAHLGGTGSNIIYNEEDATHLLGGVSAAGLGVNVAIGNDGGSQAHNNMQPYLAINYIIAMQGTFPSRN